MGHFSRKNFLSGATACVEDEGGWVAGGEGGEIGGQAEEGGRHLLQGRWTRRPAAVTPENWPSAICKNNFLLIWQLFPLSNSEEYIKLWRV